MQMNQEQFDIMQNKDGFIAALDQSGGSTPRALELYGVNEDEYSNEEEMFDLDHEMRTRIIASPAFTADKIIGTILFEHTMNNKIDGKYTGEYLRDKGIVPLSLKYSPVYFPSILLFIVCSNRIDGKYT